MIKLEVCANSIQSGIIAEKAGANQIELCVNLETGGTTPPYSQMEYAREKIGIPIEVLVRPRGGDFLYSEIEFETMERDIIHCAKIGINGVVFGILDSEGNVDKPRNTRLAKTAKDHNLNITFHRAIDRSSNILSAMEDIIELGFDRILTSGGKKDAMKGKNMLVEMIQKAKNRIIVMPGGGITANNVSELVRDTGLTEFHGSFSKRINSAMQYIVNADEFGRYDEEYTIIESDYELIKEAINNANQQGSNSIDS